MTYRDLGRHVLGAASIIFGVVAIIWHDFNTPWEQLNVIGNAAFREFLMYVLAVAQIAGGIAIQWRSVARVAALVLGVVYLIFALFFIPGIIAKPAVYNSYGPFFEDFSIFVGALIIYTAGTTYSSDLAKALQTGRILYGICTVSFTLEQAFYLSATAQFVPKWIPPGQMFWAVLTTIAFALAAIALLSGRQALLASQLTTIMIAGFGLLLWLPAFVATPGHFTWAANAQNLAIASGAWILTDYLRLAERKSHSIPSVAV